MIFSNLFNATQIYWCKKYCMTELKAELGVKKTPCSFSKSRLSFRKKNNTSKIHHHTVFLSSFKYICMLTDTLQLCFPSNWAQVGGHCVPNIFLRVGGEGNLHLWCIWIPCSHQTPVKRNLIKGLSSLWTNRLLKNMCLHKCFTD